MATKATPDASAPPIAAPQAAVDTSAPTVYRVDGSAAVATRGELWRVPGGAGGWPGGPYTFDARGGRLAYQVELTPTQAHDARLAGYTLTKLAPVSG